MTPAPALLAELQARGFRVRAADGQVRIAPAGALTPDLRDRILSVKPELLRLLAPRAHLDQGLSVREVLCFPAALLPQLPIPTTLVLELPSIAAPVLVATHAACPPRSFNADEWLAMVSLAADGDALPEALKAWSLGRDRATLAAEFRAASRTSHVAHVVAAYGCTLRAVVLEGELGHE